MFSIFGYTHKQDQFNYKVCTTHSCHLINSHSTYAQNAYAEPGFDTRNIAGLEVVVIVQDVQDVPPIFTSAPPVTKLPSGLLPGDKVRRACTNKT